MKRSVMPVSRRLLTLLVFGLVLASNAALASDDAKWEQVWDHWYTLELAGSPAGWGRETVSMDDGRYRTRNEMLMKISRGDIELEVRTTSEFIETRDGQPVQLHFVQDFSMQPVDTLWVFNDDHVLSIARQGGREVRNELPLPVEPWLAPMAAHRFRLERFKAGEEKITYRTIDGQNGVEPTIITHELQGRETLDVNGRELPVTVWNTSVSVMPGMSATSKFTADGHSIYERVNIPFGTLITRLVSQEEAMAAGAAPAPELMVNTFIEPDRPIERPRKTTTATLRLRVKEGEMPELPSAGAQRVETGEDGKTALLTIDIHDGAPAPDGEADDKEYLQPSAAADSADPMIVALAKRATKDVGDDRMERAEAMRSFVHRHISSKALDTAFATASETARMKSGDCSEHGVLLCAMLRADGIPARAAMGLVYADSFAGKSDIFGWHMWTQALIDGKWVDFDATLDERFDAGHVLTGTSSLSDGVGASAMAAVAYLLGNLQIEVVRVGYEEKVAQP